MRIISACFFFSAFNELSMYFHYVLKAQGHMEWVPKLLQGKWQLQFLDISWEKINSPMSSFFNEDWMEYFQLNRVILFMFIYLVILSHFHMLVMIQSPFYLVLLCNQTPKQQATLHTLSHIKKSWSWCILLSNLVLESTCCYLCCPSASQSTIEGMLKSTPL